MTRQKALLLRAMIEKAAVSLDDKDASMSAELYPHLKQDGSLVEAGTRINWKGEVVKAAAALWDTEQNNPDNAPNLWTVLDYVDGIRVIHETIPLTEAFSEGEKGWWKDIIYVSTVNGNVYTPEQYPPYWEAVT